ncbi:MAG: tRNA (N(6)-L-threonylcarbamoyladenosine(37)-C(2))-methylthiotransferase [Candidatus Micrarchaeota archaeon]
MFEYNKSKLESKSKYKIFIRTWGCTLNQSDSDIMRALLKNNGYKLVSSEKNAHAIVLNTCTVKGATENKIFEEIKRLKKLGKNIIIAGCLSANIDKIRKIAQRAPVVGPGAINRIGDAVKLALTEQYGQSRESALSEQNSKQEGECKGEQESERKDEQEGWQKGVFFKEYKQKFSLPRIFTFPIIRIPIQEGCVGKCTFCQTKFARPFLMSYPKKEIVRLIELAVQCGQNKQQRKSTKEIQLTGMDSGAYGIDIKTNLISLLKDIVRIKSPFKLRLGMTNPNHVKAMCIELIKLFNDEKMYKFLHMPVQTGSEKICKEMKRTHSVKDFEHCVAEFRENIPDISIATDIITAYPTESEEDYELTSEMILRVKPDVINISRFTPRHGTEAENLAQIESRIAKKRTSEMAKLAKQIVYKNAEKFVGRKVPVLITEVGLRNQMKGRMQNYRQVVVRGNKKLLGKIVTVKIVCAENGTLFGEC